MARARKRVGGDVAGLGAGDEQHPHRHRHEHRGGADVGLGDDGDAGDADDDQAAEEARIADLVGALVGEVGGEGDEHGELGELRRLEADRPDVERDLVAPRQLAVGEDQDEGADRGDVQLPRPVAEPVVVDEHHDGEHDGGDDGEDHLAGGVVEGVVATGSARRVDDEAADDRQRRLAPEQRPVDVAARGPPGWSGCCRARSPAFGERAASARFRPVGPRPARGPGRRGSCGAPR